MPGLTGGPLLVATRSAHKLQEIRDILAAEAGPAVVGLDDAGVPRTAEEETLEQFATFGENALAKARFFAARAGRATLADDSGLCVDALDGAPGVLSRRFSARTDLEGAELDAANNQLLLDRLAAVDADARTAHYVCAIALVAPDGAEHLVHGRCDGVILQAPRGDAGFGYDPLFLLPDEAATFGELPADRKNQLSHRARAVQRTIPAIRSVLSSSEPSPGG